MRVMVLVKATEHSERGLVDDAWSAEMMHAMGQFNDALREAGILREVGGLRPSSDGMRVRFDGEHRTVQAGPFVPSTEQVAGFWLWEVRDMDEALTWVKRCPNPMRTASEIEIRPLHE